MPTGFEKFSRKALEEQPINIRRAEAGEPLNETPEKKQVERLSEFVGIRTTQPTVAAMPEEKPRRGRRPKETDPNEEIFTMTIKIKMSTKLKLDELKFRERKTLQDLTAEAFEDLYKKYMG